MNVGDLDTPAVVVDLDRLERNISTMAAAAADAGARLRPHVKSHKSRPIARMQLDAGAAGLSIAKLDEAEAMSELCDDLFIAYPVVSPYKATRAARLVTTIPGLSVGVDHPVGIEHLAEAARAADRPIHALIEVDSGLGRCGVPPEEVSALVRIANRSGWVSIVGVFTHGGHAYAATSPREVEAAACDEVTAIRRAAASLPELDHPPTLSIGSTPTVRVDIDRSGINEWRPGNYAFFDRMQIALGSATPDDCALTVIATVISCHGDRAVIDAGSKVFGLDRGAHGTSLLDGFGVDIASEATVSWLSEEHGVIASGGSRFRPGDRVRLVPNHSCVVANLASEMFGVRGSRVERSLAIDVRGGGR